VTLTDVSKAARKWIVLVVLGIVFYYIFLLLLLPGVRLLARAVLPEKNPPNTVYGSLPALEFNTKQTRGDFNPKYTLDTADGKLPSDFPTKLKVYPVKVKTPSFEKGKNAINTANELGYYEQDLVTSLKEQVYKWKKSESDGLLEINTNTEDINLYTPMSNKAAYYPRGELTEEKAISYAKDILTKINRFNDPLYQYGTQNVILGEFSGSTLKETISTVDAQLARVDFFRSIDEYSIVGSDPQAGMIYVFLKRPAKDQRYFNFPIMKSYVKEIDQQTEATYPLIKPETAWNFIKENRGALVSVLPENSNLLVPYTPVNIEEVFINKIYLAYFEGNSQLDYLQPIYVFEGTYTTSGTAGGSVSFYYPAIDPAFIKAAANQN